MKIENNKELQYLNAQKRVKEIKGFYSHFTVMFFLLPFLVFINLKFTPNYRWYWWALLGNLLGLFFHWLKVLGLSSIGFGKEWEKKKIEEYMKKNMRQICIQWSMKCWNRWEVSLVLWVIVPKYYRNNFLFIEFIVWLVYKVKGRLNCCFFVHV